MVSADSFAGLARYYDVLMSHVAYDRWLAAVTELAALIPSPFRHLDAACGTGVLLRLVREAGWPSVGLDLSVGMLQAARKNNPDLPVVNADLRAVPMCNRFDYATCLFDSINFLPSEDDVRSAFRELAGCLSEDGLLYFDIVTERMVLDHFAGRKWTEDNGSFSSSWESEYSKRTGACRTRIRVNTGEEYEIREHVYPPARIEAAVEAAGFCLVGIFDAETWGRVRRKTVRIDYIATKGDPRPMKKALKPIRDTMRAMLAG